MSAVFRARGHPGRDRLCTVRRGRRNDVRGPLGRRKARRDISPDGGRYRRLLEVTKTVLRTATSYTAVDAFTAMHRLLRLRRQVTKPSSPASMRWSCRRRRVRSCWTRCTAIRLRSTTASATTRISPICWTCARVAIPNGVLPNGIPMGVTLLAPAWSTGRLIALARRLERRRRRHDRCALISRAADA